MLKSKYAMTAINFKWKCENLAGRRCSRSSDHAELDHFTSLFCRGRQRNVQRFITHVHSYCFSHENFCFWRCRFRCRRGLLKLTITVFSRLSIALRPGQTDPTSSNIVESNIVGRCCTVLNEVAKRMQHVGFNTWNREVWVQNLPTILRKRTRAILVFRKNGVRSIDCKRCFAAIALLEMLEEEDDIKTKRGKTRHWIKRRDVIKIYLQFVFNLFISPLSLFPDMILLAKYVPQTWSFFQ